MKYLATIISLVLMASPSLAETTNPAPNVYEVTEGVAFDITNAGSSNYLFSWTDQSGTFTGVADPTLILTAGQTYTFQRLSTAHPFVITDSTLTVNGSDGSYSRTTFSGSAIDAATLKPLADFTADPAPTLDFIGWSPAEANIGTHYYTCRVTSHPGMTGKIEVVSDGAVANESMSWSTLKALYRN